MSVDAIAAALGVPSSDLAFLSVHSDEERAVLLAAIEGAARAAPAVDPLAIAALLTGADPGGWLEGLAQLHEINDASLWEEITGDCALTDRGEFVSERYQITYGLFQAFCENPFTPPGDVRFDLSTTNSDLFEYFPQAERLAGLAPLAKAKSLRLSIWCRDFDNIDALEALPNTTSLHLYSCEKITDFSVIGELTGLTVLKMGNLLGMTDFGLLGKLTALRALQLFKAPALTSLSMLDRHPDLQTLSVSNCSGLTDLDGLSASTGLKKVSLSECGKLTGLSGLSLCTGLVKVDISNCQQITSLSALQPCTALTEVRLSNGALTSLDGLQDKPDLATVYLSYSVGDLESLDGLSGSTGLRSLHIDGLSRSSLSDLDGLTAASGLEDLYLTGAKKLSDISGLAGKPALTSLDLRESAITDLDALATSAGLEKVYLTNCRSLTSIAGLAGKTALETLSLQGCTRIHDVSAVPTLTSLTRLDVRSRGSRSRKPTDPCTLAVRPDNDNMEDRAAVLAWQDKIALVYAIQSGDRTEVERHIDRTVLNLYGCRMLTNPSLLQLMTNLHTLDLRHCDGLHFKVWRKNYNTPEKVAGFYARLAKKHPL